MDTKRWTKRIIRLSMLSIINPSFVDVFLCFTFISVSVSILLSFYKTKSDMLEDYFSLKISDDGCIVSLLLLLESYSPDLDRLPLFLLRLVSEVCINK